MNYLDTGFLLVPLVYCVVLSVVQRTSFTIFDDGGLVDKREVDVKMADLLRNDPCERLYA